MRRWYAGLELLLVGGSKGPWGVRLEWGDMGTYGKVGEGGMRKIKYE